MYALQNDFKLWRGALVAGSRGWTLPGADASGEDEKIYRRELIRLEMSLQAARRKSEEACLIVMTHYPPRADAAEETDVTRLLERYGASHAVFGHLHGDGARFGCAGLFRSVRYHLASCDFLGFKLLEIPGVITTS